MSTGCRRGTTATRSRSITSSARARRLERDREPLPRARQRAGFHHAKDALENRAEADVCDGELSLRAARRGFATNWETLYRRLFGARRDERTANRDIARWARLLTILRFTPGPHRGQREGGKTVQRFLVPRRGSIVGLIVVAIAAAVTVSAAGAVSHSRAASIRNATVMKNGAAPTSASSQAGDEYNGAAL